MRHLYCDDMTIDFLYTNIGRGHPSYLDGIVETLRRERLGRIADVFDVTSGVCRLAWRAVRAAYVAGGRSRAISGAYSMVRAGIDYDREALSMRLLGRGLTRTFADGINPLVVAHPLLVALLGDRQNLIYQHGEIVAPHECLVRGPHRIIVPLSRTADVFREAGFAKENIFVSGLCIEPGLVSRTETALNARLERLASSEPLCGAFFSSGAEPRVHVESIASAVLSVHGNGGRAIVFAQRAGRLERAIRILFENAGREASVVASSQDLPEPIPEILLCLYEGRRSLNQFGEALFAEFDYFVAPSHERTNWALGMGLPMFVVDPPLGNYASLNRRLLLDAGVAQAISNRAEAVVLGDRLADLRCCGDLQKMSEAGWRNFDIQGFANIAAMLHAEY